MEITEELRAKYWPAFEKKFGAAIKKLPAALQDQQFEKFVKRQVNFETEAAKAHEMVEAAGQPARDQLELDKQKLAEELEEIDGKTKRL